MQRVKTVIPPHLIIIEYQDELQWFTVAAYSNASHHEKKEIIEKIKRINIDPLYANILIADGRMRKEMT